VPVPADSDGGPRVQDSTLSRPDAGGDSDRLTNEQSGADDRPWQLHGERLVAVERRLSEIIRLVNNRDGILAQQHAELEQLRRGELHRSVMPFLRDVIKIRDHIGDLASGEHGQGSVAMFVDDSLVELLERAGAESIVPEPGDSLDRRITRAVAVLDDEGPDADRVVIAVRRCGYRIVETDAIIRPAEVLVGQRTRLKADGPISIEGI
jgi:molecular chaperone GrpE (heat shock protein)